MNLFYNPFTTYVPIIIKMFNFSYIDSLKIFASICIILSGITMYNCCNYITKNKVLSLFVSIMYLICPYKLGDIYKRFALGEFASFIFFPILAQGIYSLLNDDGKKHYYITIGASGLILTHTITTFYTIFFVFLYMLFNINKVIKKDILKKIGINLMFVILISAFYILPLLETRYTANYMIFDNQYMKTNNEYVYSHTLNLMSFFVDSGKYTDAIYIIGIPTIILFILTFFVYKKININYRKLYLIALCFAIIALYASTKYFPWFIMPNYLCILQFPWRMLAYFDFFIAFIVGTNLYVFITNLELKYKTKLIFIIFTIIFIIIYTLYIIYSYMIVKYPNISNNNLEKQLLDSSNVNLIYNMEYMPKNSYLNYDYIVKKEDKIYILNGSADILYENKKGLEYNATLKNVTNKTLIEFPLFYYPGYEIKISIDENIYKSNPVETKNGLIGIILSENAETINVSLNYVGTRLTYISYVITLFGIISFIIYIKKINKDT